MQQQVNSWMIIGPENPMLGHQTLILQSALYSNKLQNRAPCCYNVPILGFHPYRNYKTRDVDRKLTLEFKCLKQSVKSDKFWQN
jgi:hypothetical protein